MIKNEAAASEISALMLELGAKLDNSTRMVMETCDAEDFNAYCRAVGKIMTDILLEVLTPLYAAHPSLKPPELH